MVEKLKALISELEEEINATALALLRGQVQSEDYKLYAGKYNLYKNVWARLKEIEAIDKEAE